MARRGGLRVSLKSVREIRRRADQVEGVHPDVVTGRLRSRAARCTLENTELRLMPGKQPPEVDERLLDGGTVVAALGDAEVLDLGYRCQF